MERFDPKNFKEKMYRVAAHEAALMAVDHAQQFPDQEDFAVATFTGYLFEKRPQALETFEAAVRLTDKEYSLATETLGKLADIFPKLKLTELSQEVLITQTLDKLRTLMFGSISRGKTDQLMRMLKILGELDTLGKPFDKVNTQLNLYSQSQFGVEPLSIDLTQEYTKTLGQG